MTAANLQQWIGHPETLDKETLYELRTALVRYPYCQTLRLLYLKNLYILHDIGFGAELRKSALLVSDRKVLFYLIEGDKYVIPAGDKNEGDKGEAEDLSVDRTLSLIDAFLATTPEEASLQPELDYATDYSVYLLQATDAQPDAETPADAAEPPKLRGQELIDEFIEKADTEPVIKLQPLDSGDEENAQPHGPDLSHEDEDPADTYFTETLAQIYIKQRRYAKALEIIKKLSLKYPKKNTYFADQIRFLEKLIINSNSK